MSAENSSEETVAPNSDAAGKATESTKTKQPLPPMPFKEKLCLNVSVMAIAFAVLHVTGLISGLPTFLTLAVKERPAATFAVSIIATLLLTAILSSFMPRLVSVLGRLPVFAVGGFWLMAGWTAMIERYPATLGDANPVWVLIATMVLGFCVARHEDDKASVSLRIEVFSWITLGANIVAFLLTLFITVALIGGVKRSVEAKIDSEVRVHQQLNDIIFACPEVKSKKYCDALKIVTSDE